MNRTKISFITVTFNAETTLQRTLDSVAKQTLRQGVEHIIIDGASNDSTLDIAHTYKKQNPDIDIIIKSEPDKGLYDAMNKGLNMAKGEFVCFLNSGDKLHSADTLEGIFVDNDTQTVGVIYGWTDIVDNDGHFLRKRHHSPPENLTWKSFRKGMLVCHQSFYARRELCPMYDLRYRFSADVDWCIKVLKECEHQGKTTQYHAETFTDYLEEGVTTQNHKASLKERFNIMSRHYGIVSTVWNHFLFLFRQ